MDKLHAGSTSPVAVTLQVRTWALSYASWIASEDVRPDDNSTFSRTLTYHATIPSPPSAPVVSFRTFEGSTPFGIILSIGAFVLNIRTAIACCRPISSVAVRKSQLPKKGERERERKEKEKPLKAHVPTTAQPSSFLLPKHPALTATIGVRKSPKRPRSERGNGPGGSLGKIPVGMSARLAIAIVHDSI